MSRAVVVRKSRFRSISFAISCSDIIRTQVAASSSPNGKPSTSWQMRLIAGRFSAEGVKFTFACFARWMNNAAALFDSRFFNSMCEETGSPCTSNTHSARRFNCSREVVNNLTPGACSRSPSRISMPISKCSRLSKTSRMRLSLRLLNNCVFNSVAPEKANPSASAMAGTMNSAALVPANETKQVPYSNSCF